MHNDWAFRIFRSTCIASWTFIVLVFVAVLSH